MHIYLDAYKVYFLQVLSLSYDDMHRGDDYDLTDANKMKYHTYRHMHAYKHTLNQ